MSLDIKSAIKRAGKTSKEVAEILGITEVGLSQHVNGNPSVATLQKIADAVGCDVSDLFENKNQKSVCPHCGKSIKVILE